MRYSFFSEMGPRPRNEDRVLEPLLGKDGWYYAAVADGIGGSDDGALAAELAIEAVRQVQSRSIGINDIFQAAKEAIHKRSEDENNSRIGTTLTILAVESLNARYGHVGDCRIYHLRQNGIVTITRDQTEIAELVERGIFSRRQAQKYPRRGVLTSALTNYSDYDLQVGQFSVKSGDRVILLTDGLYEVIPKRDIVKLSLDTSDIKMLAKQLLVHAMKNGPRDNFSVVCIEV